MSVERLDALLPQLQCARCDYPGCRPYAEALVAGHVSPDRCTPGGAPTQQALAAVLGVEPGAPLGAPMQAQYVVIDPETCIGCTLCLPRCPVDAIVGALSQQHVILTDVCTGCGLCLPVCPVDCIQVLDRPPLSTSILDNPPMQARATTARKAHEAHLQRIRHPREAAAPLSKQTIRADIRAALARAALPKGHDAPQARPADL